MKRLVLIVILAGAVLSFLPTVSAAEAMDPQRFEQVVGRLVDAINRADYEGIQTDFGEMMLSVFPLEVSKPFFKNLTAQHGKIQKLDSPQLIPPNQAVFPAHFEEAIMDIKVVLDEQDKIVGLWFLPHMTDPNEQFDPNDPNAVAKRQWLEKIEEIMEDIDQRGKDEIRTWVDIQSGRSIRTAPGRIYDQVEDEFEAIREVAVEEEAERTVELIDLLLGNRAKRLEEIIQKIEEERRRERLREREERTTDRDRETRRRDRTPRRSSRDSGY